METIRETIEDTGFGISLIENGSNERSRQVCRIRINGMTCTSCSSTIEGILQSVNDLYSFETTSQVPQGLGSYVVSSKKAQANWYGKMLEAWKQAKYRPQTSEEAAKLVIETLKGHKKSDVEGLLSFYRLPSLHEVSKAPHVSVPEGVRFQLQTLPVDQKYVADGDTITVYVSNKYKIVSNFLAREVTLAVEKRAKALEEKNYTQAESIHKKIIASGYRMISCENKEVLGQKFRIRLRGIDSPESKMPFGKEARDELVKIIEGKSLKVLVYTHDHYGRCIGDVYCTGIFIQEVMLRKGLAWHYRAYDKRPQLAKWEHEAKQEQLGLWSTPNPEEPWEWRKKKRGQRLIL